MNTLFMGKYIITKKLPQYITEGESLLKCNMVIITLRKVLLKYLTKKARSIDRTLYFSINNLKFVLHKSSQGFE